MKYIFQKGFLLLALLLTGATRSNALDVETHEAINEYIAQNTLNSFSLDSYLKNNLGLTNGKEEKFNSLEVYKWLRDGGKFEDKPPEWYSIPYLRSVNHFHNPLTDAGFSGYFFGLLLSGDSSTVWAQKNIGTQSPGGYYSWQDVRRYYYIALTGKDYDSSPVALTKELRDNYFAETFRGLGQLMHLVEDLSVPAHTRDDFHYFYNYETWAMNNVNINSLPNYGATFFNGTINNIASFMDTNQYNNPNPDPTVTANLTEDPISHNRYSIIGLAEYTQANFFSEDTIFGSNFLYPQITQDMTVREDDFTNNMTTYKRQYYLKNCCGETNGIAGYRLAAVDLLDYWRQQDPEMYGGLSKIPSLDDNVYSDYASLLIPRAVGYSAGLLNYFFRGQIDMVPDPNSQGNYIIENYGNEAINASDGVFTLYYDGTDELRHQINWTFPSDGRISVPAADANGPGKSTSVSFLEPTDAQETGKYILVYKGTLGNEQDIAVVGKEVSTPEFLYSAIALWGGWVIEKRNGKDGSLVWTQQLANTDSAPTAIAASADGVFTVGWIGYYDGVWRIEKRDTETGNLVWQQEMVGDYTGTGWGGGAGNGIYPMDISVDESGVYVIGAVLGSDWYMYNRYEKRSLTDGSIIWAYEERDIYGGIELFSCNVDDNGIYFGTEKDAWTYDVHTGGVEKRNKESGVLLWELETGMFDPKVAADDQFLYVSDYVPKNLAMYNAQVGLYIVKIDKDSGGVAGIFSVPTTLYSPATPYNSVTSPRLMVDGSSIYLLTYIQGTSDTPTLIKIDKNSGAVLGLLDLNAYRIEMGKADLYLGGDTILKYSKSLVQKWDTGPLPYSGYPEVQSMSVFTK